MCLIEVVKRRVEDELGASVVIEEGKNRAPLSREQIDALRGGKKE